MENSNKLPFLDSTREDETEAHSLKVPTLSSDLTQGWKTIKETTSLCPECLAVVPASLVVRRGRVYLSKTCPRHGPFEYVYWSSADLYERANKYAVQTVEPLVRQTEVKNKCPQDCGLCPNHKNHTILAVMDITGLCNARCPTCFASADKKKEYVYEPNMKQIRFMLDSIAGDVHAMQLTGGEPTLRPDLYEIIHEAKLREINHVELNTNGIVFASSKGTELTRSLEGMFGEDTYNKGLSTVYLKFNGFSSSTWEATTGDPNWGPIPLRAIQNIKKGYCDKRRSPGIMLVPTLIRGLNDYEIEDIIEFAMKESYVVRGVNFQPVSFAGSMSKEDIKKKRYTLSDFFMDVEDQTKGDIKAEDFFPISCVSPFAETVWQWKNRGVPGFSCHQHCGAMTALMIRNNDFVPVNRYVNMDRFFVSLQKAAYYFKQGKNLRGKINVVRALTGIKRQGIGTLLPLVKDVAGDVDNWRALGTLLLHMVFIGGMHFMDKYNFDLKRVQMCPIHQILPDGSRVPFCTYQTIHRPLFEKRFSIPSTKRIGNTQQEEMITPTLTSMV